MTYNTEFELQCQTDVVNSFQTMEESDFSDHENEGDSGQEEALDPNNPEHAFAIIEKNYNKVVFLLFLGYLNYLTTYSVGCV